MLNIKVRKATPREMDVFPPEDAPCEGFHTLRFKAEWQYKLFTEIGEGDWHVSVDDPQGVLTHQITGVFLLRRFNESETRLGIFKKVEQPQFQYVNYCLDTEANEDGTLPESGTHGPFENREAAIADAKAEWASLGVAISHERDGNLCECDGSPVCRIEEVK